MTTKTKTEMTIDREKRQLTISRAFAAPRALVWRAMTDAELMPQWWGPGYLTTTVERLELWPGGRYRFVQRDAEGNEYAFRGQYREVTPPERVAMSFEFEGMAGHVIEQVMTLTERDGRTTLTVVETYPSLEDLDGMLESGMEDGMNESYERLDALLAMTN